MDLLSILKGAGKLVYIINPHDYFYKDISSVPNIIGQALPYFFFFIFLEACIITYKSSTSTDPKHYKNKPYRVNHAITSASAGMAMLTCNRLLPRNLEIPVYLYMYHNHALWNLPVNLSTWFLTMLIVDFGWYVFHVCAHQVNLFWASHVVHHSSQDYNLTNGNRLSIIQEEFFWFYYIPVAILGIPPSIFLVHRQFNTLYEFWLHTKLIDKMPSWYGFIFNTPSHHRVHHGVNPYCIDKNFGSTLIIWDRIFGTFQAERDDEPVVFGLVGQLDDFSPIHVHFHHFIHIYRKFRVQIGCKNKFKAIFYGPGWTPTKPDMRLGDPNDIPSVPNMNQNPYGPRLDDFNPGLSRSMSTYVVCTFMTCFVNLLVVETFNFDLLGLTYSQGHPWARSLGLFNLLSLLSIGLMLNVGDPKPRIRVNTLFKYGWVYGFECIRVGIISPILYRSIGVSATVQMAFDFIGIVSVAFMINQYMVIRKRSELVGKVIISPILKSSKT